MPDDACPLPGEYRQLGIEHFVQGRSARDLADHHRMTLHTVRKMLAFVRGWHKGMMTRK